MRYEQSRYEPPTKDGDVWRKRIEYDDEYGLVLLADEHMTSNSPRGQVVFATTLELTNQELYWLRDKINSLIHRLENRESYEELELAETLNKEKENGK